MWCLGILEVSMKVAAGLGLLMMSVLTITGTQVDRSQIIADLNTATANAQRYVPGLSPRNAGSAANQEFARKAISSFEAVLVREPQNVAALSGLAGLYQSMLEFTKARDLYLRLTRVDPQNPLNFYAVGSINWILVYDRQKPLPQAERPPLIDEGLENLAAAIRLNPLYDEAMTYTNLLLRQKASLATDPAEEVRLRSEADQWIDKALAIRMLKAGGTAGGTPPPPPPPPQGAIPTQIGADVAQRNLITRVEPKYPTLGLRTLDSRMFVTLQTTIDRTGAVTDVKILRGHPLMNEAVIEAVKQWKYKPYLLNGQPIDVTTTLVVNFSTR
jgi:TonB family protein